MSPSSYMRIGIAGFCLAMVGCGAAPSEAGDESGSRPSPERTAQSEAVPVAIPRNKPRPTAATWHDELAQLSAAQQSFVETTNTKYFGSLVPADDEEAAWLMRSGFPGARQLAVYASLSEDELRDRAANGSNLDRLMYADRLAETIQQLKQDLPEDVAISGPLEEAKMAALRNAGFALRDRSNIFAAYVYGHVDSKITGSAGSIAGGLIMATHRGDRRASRFARELERHQPVSAAMAMTIYSGMQRAARAAGD